ncbi:hypothetical protein [Mesorhizobium australicum]|uniref:hypothetical protein n=1 Tax=Mesorhizobium australicum TaxID=536018 RepID=UPI003339D449
MGWMKEGEPLSDQVGHCGEANSSLHPEEAASQDDGLFGPKACRGDPERDA